MWWLNITFLILIHEYVRRAVHTNFLDFITLLLSESCAQPSWVYIVLCVPRLCFLMTLLYIFSNIFYYFYYSSSIFGMCSLVSSSFLCVLGYACREVWVVQTFSFIVSQSFPAAAAGADVIFLLVTLYFNFLHLNHSYQFRFKFVESCRISLESFCWFSSLCKLWMLVLLPLNKILILFPTILRSMYNFLRLILTSRLLEVSHVGLYPFTKSYIRGQFVFWLLKFALKF